MPSLDDFLHKGTLPFIGRDAELERLVQFWRATPYAQGLRASLVQAEAGIGKSRLLDEVIRRVVAEEGAVVHVKLYPESSVSLAPLLAPALWHSNVGRELLRAEPESSLSSVIGALRRLSRLRPTLLVLEDTHLLSPESTPELASLLNALADETISLLCLCRPAEWRGRAVLEGYVVERIELEGLAEGAIGQMWERLFGSPCERSVPTLLHGATLGNALALRSILRSAIDSGVIARSGGTWRLGDRAGTFEALTRRNVATLSAGMVAHLSPDELKAAGCFASLGEVFARETALALVEGGGPMLDTLITRGIIATTTMLPSPIGGIPPLPGVPPPARFPMSAHPLLAFTHTLLHKYLVEHAGVDPEGLVAVIAAGEPLYSVLPFILVREHATRLNAGTPGIDIAAERSLFSAWLLDKADDGTTGLQLWETASALADVMKEKLSEEQRERWPLRLLQIRTSLVRFMLDERAEASRQFYEATRDSRNERLIPMRLVALSYYLTFRRQSLPTFYLAVWEEVEQVAAEFPAQRLTDGYFQVLSAIADIAAARVDFHLARLIRERLAMLEMEMGTDERMREQLVWRLYPPILALYSTQEELEDRNMLYRRLVASPVEMDRPSWHRRLAFLTHTGRMSEFLEVVEEAVSSYQLRGDLGSILFAGLDRMVARSAFGWDLGEIASDLRQLMRSVTGCGDTVEHHTAAWVAAIGLLRGDVEWAWRFYEELPQDATNDAPPRILLCIASGRLAEAEELLRDDWPPQYLIDREGYELLGVMLRFLLHGEGAPELLAAQAGGRLRLPVLRLYDITVVSGVIDLLDRMSNVPEFAPFHESLRDTLRDTLDMRLQWLAERGLSGFMTPLIERHGRHMAPAGLKKWIGEIAAITAERNARLRPEGEQRRKVRVSMLGTIQVAPAGGEMAPLRGVRIRTLLGLMVADQMIGSTLTPQEFVLLAGEDEDPELARKKRNMGVVRLREIMGVDAILTDGKTPRLNPDLVEVDLLRADDFVKRALAAAREAAWVRAHPLLMEALELTGGDVPFPTLYESFFEAARDDFEFRLRSAVLDVSRGLLREGDTGGAEEILRRAFASMPDDEEIADLLRDALTTRGNRVEAERVRLRAV